MTGRANRFERSLSTHNWLFRSQLGNRDSEIAVVIEDTDMVNSKINGKEVRKAAKPRGGVKSYLMRQVSTKLDGLHWPCACTFLRSTWVSYRWTIVTLLATLMQSTDIQHWRPITWWWTHWTIISMIMCGTQPRKRIPLFIEMSSIVCQMIQVRRGGGGGSLDIWRRLKLKDDPIFFGGGVAAVLTFDSHRRFVPDPARIPPGHIANPWRMNYDDVMAKLNKVKGHLVVFPTQYLSQENMTASLVQEAVPPTVFT